MKKQLLWKRLLIRKSRNVFFVCFIILLILPVFSFAQNIISGTVRDDNGKPLINVSVMVKNAIKGTTTNDSGSYNISASPSDILVFSVVGHTTQEIEVGDNLTINVELVPQHETMDEVVAIGYGTVRKSDLTGSVSSVKAGEVNAFPAANVLQTLSGRAAGVQVRVGTGEPGGDISMRIRGSNSIRGDNEPLYVIDGFPVNNANSINNADIQNVEILKDASAVAIYGSRGANGVVLITTKSGHEGRTRVDYESNYGVQVLRKRMKLMNARQYAEFYNLQRENDGQDPYFTDIEHLGEGFDWQDFVFTDASIQSHSLTVSGGTSRTQFSLSGSIFGQNGIIRGSDYDRYSLRTRLNHTISNKFRVGLSTVLSRVQTARQSSSGQRFGGSLISGSLVIPPTLTPYNDDGSYRVLANVYPFISESMVNPLNFINEEKDNARVNKLLATGFLAYEPLPGLVFKVNGGVETSDNRDDYYRTLNFVNSVGIARANISQYMSLLNENTVSYTRTFNEKHNLVALGGFTYQDFTTTSLRGSGQDFLSDATESYNLSTAAVPGVPVSSYSKSVLLSYLGRLNYTFDNRILATVSFRADGSSKFSTDNKWGFFPSAALAWRLTNERFFRTQNLFSDLKVRTSWGRTGSQAIGAYATLSLLSGGKTVFGKALYNTFSPSTRFPGMLKWETTEQADIGIDVAFLNNRLRITTDYYNKITRDLLNTVQLPSSMGYITSIRNIGQVRNRGFEFAAEGVVLTGAFQWNVNGNISFNRSKILKLAEEQDILASRIDMLIFADDVTLLREGLPMGVFYGYLEDGYDENGAIKYKDLSNDGSISIDDKTILGDPNPDFTYGLNSSMSFKGFDLNIFLQGSHGNDIVNVSKVGNTLHYGYGNNMLEEVFYDHWTPEKTDAKYPKITRAQVLNFSDRFVEDGSYLRLKNIELGYHIPTNRLNLSWIQSARIYISGQNLLTFTKYSWWDPEVNSLGGGISQGIDYSTYPIAKTYTVGINISF